METKTVGLTGENDRFLAADPWLMKARRNVLLLLLIFSSSIWAANSGAAAIEPLTTISQAATEFATQHATAAGFQDVSTKARPLDKRLRLARCTQPLETFAPQPKRVLGKTTVGVRCPDEAKPWTLYVSVTTTAQQQVPVLVSALPRGKILSRADLKMVEKPLNQGHQQIITNPVQIIGKQLRRPVQEGATLSHQMLMAPKIVKRGQQITLIAHSGTLKVRMAGKAMADGAAGDRVRAKNLSSGTVVEGVINEDGTVRVN